MKFERVIEFLFTVRKAEIGRNGDFQTCSSFFPFISLLFDYLFGCVSNSNGTTLRQTVKACASKLKSHSKEFANYRLQFEWQQIGKNSISGSVSEASDCFETHCRNNWKQRGFHDLQVFAVAFNESFHWKHFKANCFGYLN